MNKKIKRIILSVAVLVAATDFSFAQSYSIIPGDSVEAFGMLDDLQTLSIQQLNISADTIQLQWKKISESVPANWEASVCDNAACNTSLLDSGTMLPVIPGEYGLVLIHITPHQIYGMAIIKYAVWDINTPQLKDTLTYILSVNPTGIAGEFYSNNDFSIYPNPCADLIFIHSKFSSSNQYLISDYSGKEIQSGNSIADFISTKNIANGFYFISILEKNKILFVKKIIVQH